MSVAKQALMVTTLWIYCFSLCACDSHLYEHNLAVEHFNDRITKVSRGPKGTIALGFKGIYVLSGKYHTAGSRRTLYPGTMAGLDGKLHGFIIFEVISSCPDGTFNPDEQVWVSAAAQLRYLETQN